MLGLIFGGIGEEREEGNRENGVLVLEIRQGRDGVAVQGEEEVHETVG